MAITNFTAEEMHGQGQLGPTLTPNVQLTFTNTLNSTSQYPAGYFVMQGSKNANSNLIPQPEGTLLLDTFTDASVAYSLRKMRAAYAGSAIRVRRSIDNAEQDIGFVNNELDTNSLLAFVDGGNGFVSVIYDQVSDKNMTQLTNPPGQTYTRQGSIVNGGKVNYLNGYPSIIRSIDNSGGYVSTYDPNAGATTKGVYYVGAGGNKPQTTIAGSTNSGLDKFGNAAEGSNAVAFDETVSGNYVSNIKINDVSLPDNLTRGNMFNNTRTQFLLSVNADFAFSGAGFGLGYAINLSPPQGMMTFQELVIFDNTTNYEEKQTNINRFYSIYGPVNLGEQYFFVGDDGDWSTKATIANNMISSIGIPIRVAEDNSSPVTQGILYKKIISGGFGGRHYLMRSSSTAGGKVNLLTGTNGLGIAIFGYDPANTYDRVGGTEVFVWNADPELTQLICTNEFSDVVGPPFGTSVQLQYDFNNDGTIAQISMLNVDNNFNEEIPIGLGLTIMASGPQAESKYHNLGVRFSDSRCLKDDTDNESNQYFIKSTGNFSLRMEDV